MKKRKPTGVAALILLALSNPVTVSASANVTDYQETNMSQGDTISADCEVIYKTTYDFSQEIPKYPKLEVSASGYDGVYDGESHSITIDCKTEGATILYSTDGKTYTTKKPAYKDAGTYVIYYKVEKDGYIMVTGTEIVRIKEAVIDFTVYGYNGVYDGKAHSIGLSTKTEGCKILYSEDGINFTLKKPEYKEPGTYVVYYKIMKDNYTTVTGSSIVTIKKEESTTNSNNQNSNSNNSNSQNSSNQNNHSDNTSISKVQTGDKSNPLIYGVMFTVSLLGLVGSRGRREETENEECK